MPTNEEIEIGIAATRAAMDGTVDPHLVPCPECGADQLRAEVRTEWRPISEVCEMFGITPAVVKSSGAKLDGFGRVASAVPYVTCMSCGLDADASKAHIGLRF